MLGSSGLCPKCEKHFDRLRTHANSCLKSEYEKYLSLPNANTSTSSISIKESKSVQDLQIISKSENKKALTSESKSTKANLKKTKSEEEIKVKKSTEIIQPAQSDSTDSITSKIKIQDKPQTDKLEQIKFQEFFETVIEKLKNQSLSDGSCQYRFDFVKLRCDVKKIQPENVESKHNEDRFNRNDLYPDFNKQTVSDKKQKITPVLLVSNLDADSVNIDALFILFGVYGDVQRIKMIDKKLCFIEFTNKEQAELAMENLDNCKLWTKQIKVYPCAHDTISSSRDSSERNCVLKEFLNSHLHRFRYRKPDSHNYINRPSATLHLSNIPSNVTTNELNYLFERCGRVVALRFHTNNGNKALIQMSSVEEGVLALINNHGKQLGKNMHLRCNFHHRNVNNF